MRQRNFALYVKIGSKTIPFRHYRRPTGENTHIDIDTDSDTAKENTLNRWAIRHFCGKKFIANPDTPDAAYVTPNEIVAVPYGIAWERVSLLYLTICAGYVIFYLADLIMGNDYFGFVDLLDVAIAVTVTGMMLSIFSSFSMVSQYESKKDAERFNSEIIPPDKL